MTLTAIVKTLEGGYPYDEEQIKESCFEIGDRFAVKDVSMGQSHTTIYLVGTSTGYNSIFFKFEEDGEPISIYEDKRYNPYL